MKTITFTSHYNKQEMNVRVSNDKAENIDELLELYHLDSDRMAAGYEPQTFSRAQIKRLNKALIGIDYWDNIAEA